MACRCCCDTSVGSGDGGIVVSDGAGVMVGKGEGGTETVGDDDGTSVGGVDGRYVGADDGRGTGADDGTGVVDGGSVGSCEGRGDVDGANVVFSARPTCALSIKTARVWSPRMFLQGVRDTSIGARRTRRPPAFLPALKQSKPEKVLARLGVFEQFCVKSGIGNWDLSCVMTS